MTASTDDPHYQRKDSVTRTALTHATIVTVDADDSVIDDGTIAITGDTITDVLPAGHGPLFDVDRVVDAQGGIVMPGSSGSPAAVTRRPSLLMRRLPARV